MSDLNDRTSALVGFDLAAMVERVRDLSRDSDRCRAAAEHMEHLRKVVLAEAMLEARQRADREGRKITADVADAEARTSVAYRNHLDALRHARDQQADAYAQYSAGKAALDLALRQLSFAQTEAKLST